MKSHHVFHRTAQLLHLSERPEYERKPSALWSMLGGMLPAAEVGVGAPGKGAAERSPEEVDERLLKRFVEKCRDRA